MDYVSESGEIAGANAAKYAKRARREIPITADKSFLYAVPQTLNLNADNHETILYFRSRDILNGCRFVLSVDGKEVFSKKYPFLRPPEMEKLVLDFSKFDLNEHSEIKLNIEVKENA